MGYKGIPPFRRLSLVANLVLGKEIMNLRQPICALLSFVISIAAVGQMQEQAAKRSPRTDPANETSATELSGDFSRAAIQYIVAVKNFEVSSIEQGEDYAEARVETAKEDMEAAAVGSIASPDNLAALSLEIAGVNHTGLAKLEYMEPTTQNADALARDSACLQAWKESLEKRIAAQPTACNLPSEESATHQEQPVPSIHATSDSKPDNPTESAAQSEIDKTAHIVIYRARHFEGSALKPEVRLDGRQILKLVNGRFFSLDVSPGEHVLTTDQELAPVRISLSSGQTIYVQGVVRTFRQFSNGRLELFEAVPDDARKQIQDLKPLDRRSLLDE